MKKILRRVRSGRRGTTPTTHDEPRHAPSPSPRRRVLLDDDLQRRFDEQGFVVVDLLDDGGLARLMEGYRSLEHTHERWLPFADGFHTTLYDAREDYRLAVRDVIRGTVGVALDAVLDRYAVHFANFTVKLPGGDTVPEHLDWTFCDEGVASSVTVWTAMQATDELNGALGVVPGSHRRVGFVRAVNNRSYDAHSEAAGLEAPREVVGLRPGQAIVMDNRVVHFSPPNTTDEIRLAAACVATPAEEPMLHYWFDDEGRPHRLEVGPDFWISYSPGMDPRDAEGCVGDGVVTDREVHFA